MLWVDLGRLFCRARLLTHWRQRTDELRLSCPRAFYVDGGLEARSTSSTCASDRCGHQPTEDVTNATETRIVSRTTTGMYFSLHRSVPLGSWLAHHGLRV